MNNAVVRGFGQRFPNTEPQVPVQGLYDAEEFEFMEVGISGADLGLDDEQIQSFSIADS
jgi:hypothetical protein